ncbi:hypothetical protein MseVgp139 [Melanoplus sanguinipes entomopoxvirus]|uniref:Uncharacterized protein n=1 Tax=Melanoplus sanguinipes entomopoxvirus TaxID=83191 RepID=Q9YVV3_MSEPV|nr:hypothetical protein MseVgp139 [Melanoplus sanguinipes entomopoxvirus]AAC97671.1 ORF MSV139 hypothetical protein [Melanoplus sanguinipes entomopoxvirus 'O']
MKIEYINKNIWDFLSDIDNISLIVFISADYISSDDYFKYIKNKYNSIKTLKNQKKTKGEVSYIYKYNVYIYYILISDYIEDIVDDINIRRSLSNFNELITTDNIATSMSHMKFILPNYNNTLSYISDHITNIKNLYICL